MTLKTIIVLLTGLLHSAITLSQDKIRIDILPSKIAGDVQMIIPSGPYLIFERYRYFKYNYWVGVVDTLTEDEVGFLKGKIITISPATFTKTVDKCDTIINKIRNSALDHRLFSELLNIARRDIGYDNQEFKSSLSRERPTARQILNLCHDDFSIVILKWFTSQTNSIAAVKTKKVTRLVEIQSNAANVDREYIRTFLNDYGSCETDHLALLALMMRFLDEFLTVCKDLPDMSFFDIKLKLSTLPDNVKTADAVEKLKASHVRTKRKGQLIRELKKNAP